MTKPRITIIGLGLIGSSIARAAHSRNIAKHIIGVDSNEVTLGYARKNGFVSDTSTDAAAAVKDADIVIIATPTPLLAGICKEIASVLKSGALVMDTGSVKQLPLAVMGEFLPAHALIVPAHPIAGSEQSGIAAGHEDLLEKKRIIITPDAPLSTAALQQVNSFWQSLGARVEAMPAALHDTIYGYVSHLPQLLAYGAAEVVDASGALSRFLRIAASDRTLWRDIFLLNAEVITAALDRYLDALSHIHRELKSAPHDAEIKETNADTNMLFARIAASCLVTTVMEAEKKAGVPFARFAGTGFADFTSPATSEPEGDLEHISNHYAALIPMLAAYEVELLKLRSVIPA